MLYLKGTGEFIFRKEGTITIRKRYPNDDQLKTKTVVINDYSVSYYSFPVGLVKASASILRFPLFKQFSEFNVMRCCYKSGIFL
jgi:hypothetical protein